MVKFILFGKDRLSQWTKAQSGVTADGLLGLLAQGANLGFVLVVYSWFVVLQQQDLAAFWLVLALLLSLMSQADFGFQISLSRNFSFVLAGAQRLQSEGVQEPPSEGARNTKVDDTLAWSVICAARRIYFRIGSCSALIGLPLGYLYLTSVGSPYSKLDLGISWGIFSFAIAINFFLSPYSVALFGASKVREWYLSILLNRGSFIVGLTLLSFDGLTLIDVALCFLLGVLISRGYVYHEALPIFDRFKNQDAEYETVAATTRAVLPNALRLGLISMSAFLSLKFGALFLSSHIGVDKAEALNFWSSVFIAILALSSSFANTRAPSLAQLWVVGNENDIVREVFWIYRNAVSVFLTLSTLIFIFSFFSPEPDLFSFPSFELPWLLALFVMYFLELLHSIACIIISTLNKIPFFWASILSGMAIVALTILWVPLIGWTAVILSQGLVQLAYNNWRWPLFLYALLLRRLNVRKKLFGR